MIPKNEGDRGARFVVGHQVGQTVRAGISFTGTLLTDTPGEIHLRLDDVAPNRIERLSVGGISHHGRDVRHRGIKVASSHRVPDRFPLLRNRLVVLRVRPVESLSAFSAPSLIDEELGQLEIAPLSSDSVEFHQSDLDLFMASHVFALLRSRPELASHQVGTAHSHIEQRTFSSGSEMSHGRFAQVPDVVQFVAMIEFRPARSFGVRVVGPRRLHGIEVAVRFLSGCDFSDESIEVFIELPIVTHGQRVSSAFDDFENIRVVVADAAKAGRVPLSRRFEVADSARLLAASKARRQCHLAVGFDSGSPEGIGQVDLFERNGTNGIAGLLCPHSRRTLHVYEWRHENQAPSEPRGNWPQRSHQRCAPNGSKLDWRDTSTDTRARDAAIIEAAIWKEPPTSRAASREDRRVAGYSTQGTGGRR